ncbi:MAG: OmpH family outer membrane protein [Desulfovibrio sp.]|nr:OmpH family outer membrane protein [Desulfovibrio sp.]
MRHILLTALLALPLLICGCWKSEDKGHQTLTLAVVDVERVMRDSRAAKEGISHLEAATARLQDGWKQLQEASKNEPPEQRRVTLANGLQTLQQQIRAEEAQVRQIVHNLLVEEVKKWRQTNKAVAVIALQNLLDASGTHDITMTVMEAMNTKKVKFPDLPVVTVSPPEQPAGAQREQGKNEPKKNLRPAAR